VQAQGDNSQRRRVRSAAVLSDTVKGKTQADRKTARF